MITGKDIDNSYHDEFNDSLIEVLYYVKEKLLKQNSKSMSKDGHLCRYRGENDTKCAIGWMIKDEDYHNEIEGHCPAAASFDRVNEELYKTVYKFCIENDLISDKLFNYNQDYHTSFEVFLNDLQTLHDEFEVYSWEERFDIIKERIEEDYYSKQKFSD